MAKKIKSVKIRVISVICVLFSHPSPFFPFLPLLPPILFSFLPPFTKHSFHTKHLFQKHYLTAKQPFPFLTLLARYLNFHLFHPLPVFVRQNHFRGGGMAAIMRPCGDTCVWGKIRSSPILVRSSKF